MFGFEVFYRNFRWGRDEKRKEKRDLVCGKLKFWVIYRWYGEWLWVVTG